MGLITEQARTERSCPAISRFKAHLREVRLAGQSYRLITLRADARVAFSTNYFHDTWHIVSDQFGSRLLARLVWGLAFQRQQRTAVLIHGQHLQPTPFEAERSDPFLLLPAHLTSADPDAFRDLKTRLKNLGPPTRTIRWQTFGLDLALQAEREERERALDGWRCTSCKDNEHLSQEERMGRCGGLIYYSAPPRILRQQALRIHSLRTKTGKYLHEMDYHDLAEARERKGGFPDGEVQIFWDYRERVAAAVEARKELTPYPNQPILDESLQERISRRRDAIRRRKKKCRKRQNVSRA